MSASDQDFDEFYRRYGHLVFARCRALVGNLADAEDVMQEVFFRAHKAGSAEPIGLAWLYAVATNLCHDLGRKKARHRAAEPTLQSAPAEVAAGDQVEARDFFLHAFQGLDPKTARIGALHYMDGFTQEDVATQTGYSRKTVGKKLKEFVEHMRRRNTKGEVMP